MEHDGKAVSGFMAIRKIADTEGAFDALGELIVEGLVERVVVNRTHNVCLYRYRSELALYRRMENLEKRVKRLERDKS